ncbi:MAG: FHA domain-containing protein, partial [Persicimonas sp.]
DSMEPRANVILVGGVHPIGQRLTIGASEGDLRFPEDGLLASPHTVIRREQDRYLLRDVDSDTGTFIRIANAVELIDGDCFLVGRTRIRLTFA